MPFDLQPTLSGALVTLRPLHADDFDALFAAAADPLIWEQHPASDRYTEAVFRGYFEEGLRSGGALIALDARDGRIIGSSRFHGYDEKLSEIEIGWTFLVRSHWGGKYNGEMKELMLRHAFRFVDRVFDGLLTPTERNSRPRIQIAIATAMNAPITVGRLSVKYVVNDVLAVVSVASGAAAMTS